MTPSGESLTWRIGDLTGAIEADSPAFLSYARQHMAPALCVPCPAPVISARLLWHERPPRARTDLTPGLAAMERPDRDLYVEKGRIAWFRIDDLRQLVLQARRAGEGLQVQGDYHFYLNRNPQRDRLRRVWERRALDARREKRFATLLYYLAYYPAMWWLENHAATHPLHAAGVAGERGAIVLAGPSGVGKSTLTVALTAAGGNPLSETFLLHRGRDLVAVPEPVLLDTFSQRWLGDGAAQLGRAPGSFVFERDGFHLEHNVRQAPAAAIVLPRRASPAGIAPLTPAVAHRRISGGHQLVKDMRRYWAFAAAFENLGSASEAEALMLQRERALAALVAAVPCWELRLTSDLSRAAVTDMLADIANRSGAGSLSAPAV